MKGQWKALPYLVSTISQLSYASRVCILVDHTRASLLLPLIRYPLNLTAVVWSDVDTAVFPTTSTCKHKFFWTKAVLVFAGYQMVFRLNSASSETSHLSQTQINSSEHIMGETKTPNCANSSYCAHFVYSVLSTLKSIAFFPKERRT